MTQPDAVSPTGGDIDQQVPSPEQRVDAALESARVLHGNVTALMSEVSFDPTPTMGDDSGEPRKVSSDSRLVLNDHGLVAVSELPTDLFTVYQHDPIGVLLAPWQIRALAAEPVRPATEDFDGVMRRGGDVSLFFEPSPQDGSMQLTHATIDELDPGSESGATVKEAEVIDGKFYTRIRKKYKEDPVGFSEIVEQALGVVGDRATEFAQVAPDLLSAEMARRSEALTAAIGRSAVS